MFSPTFNVDTTTRMKVYGGGSLHPGKMDDGGSLISEAFGIALFARVVGSSLGMLIAGTLNFSSSTYASHLVCVFLNYLL